jgi:hypothetical protein
LPGDKSGKSAPSGFLFLLVVVLFLEIEPIFEDEDEDEKEEDCGRIAGSDLTAGGLCAKYASASGCQRSSVG